MKYACHFMSQVRCFLLGAGICDINLHEEFCRESHNLILILGCLLQAYSNSRLGDHHHSYSVWMKNQPTQ